jgi:hypothetical protein
MRKEEEEIAECHPRPALLHEKLIEDIALLGKI